MDANAGDNDADVDVAAALPTLFVSMSLTGQQCESEAL